MAQVVDEPLTYRDYAQLPDDGKRYEVIEGRLHVSPSPTTWHQTVSRRLQHVLMTQLEDRGVAWIFNAPCDLIVADTTIVQPDLLIVRCDRKDAVTRRAVEAPPDVVIEILSPSTRTRDQRLKKRVYAGFGIAEYWVVDPEPGEAEVLALASGGYRNHERFGRDATLRSPSFPEIEIPLSRVFAPLR